MSILQLIKNFKNLQKNESCIFVLRHAEKPITHNMTSDIANSITKKGVADSKQLGSTLKSFYPKISLARSSTIKRCLETANNILLGYPTTPSPISDHDLGGNGGYVADSKLTAKHFTTNPSRKDIFVRMQKGELFEGMQDVKTGTNILLNKIKNDLNKIDAPALYVTHDCVLALFVGTLTNQIIDEKNWFQYLEGVCIKKEENKLFLHWKNSRFDITSFKYNHADNS